MRSGIGKGPRENTHEFRKNIPTGGWGLTCKYTTKHVRAQRRRNDAYGTCDTKATARKKEKAARPERNGNGRAADDAG